MDTILDINGAKIAFNDLPAAPGCEVLPPVVLLHGWGCTRATLAGPEATAHATGRRVINVDFPGFGASPEPPAVWGVDEYARLIEGLLDRLEIVNPVLLGHSFGGRVSITIASRRPVSKLILVDAAGVKPHRKPKYYLKVYSFKAAKLLWKLIYGAAGAEQRIEAYRKAHSSADYAAASPRMRAVLSKVVNQDLCSLMPSIQAPTLLVWGTADTATPISDARKMERLIPGAALVEFPGAGHFSFLDRAAQFNAVLTSFLNATD